MDTEASLLITVDDLEPGDEEIWEQAAKDGSMDYKHWPALLKQIMPRLNDISNNDFPTPVLPPSPSSPSHLHTSLTQPSHDLKLSEHDSTFPSTPHKDKEHSTTPSRPPVPLFSSPPIKHLDDDLDDEGSSTADKDALTSTSLHHSTTTPLPKLPSQLLDLLAAIDRNLQTNFAKNPPHTIQRLAELLLRPTAHYRTLPPFLRAVDRVISVTSGAHIFPLPSVGVGGAAAGASLINGINANASLGSGAGGLGSDESLGGALLTPIPWLREKPSSEDGEGSEAGGQESQQHSLSGDSSVDEQGQQEQDTSAAQESADNVAAEAADVPLLLSPSVSASAATTIPITTEIDEAPHARGPAAIGVADTGLQHGRKAGSSFDLEVALGRSPEPFVEVGEADVGEKESEEVDVDEDGDLVIVDAADAVPDDGGAAKKKEDKSAAQK